VPKEFVLAKNTRLKKEPPFCEYRINIENVSVCDSENRISNSEIIISASFETYRN